jgi:hypothetical protein
MKKLFETWRKYIVESKVVNLHRYAFNKASMDLYKWFEDIVYQDTSIDESDPNYDKLVIEKAELVKYAFLEKKDTYGVELALEMLGISTMYMPVEYVTNLLSIMAEYEKREAML